MSVLLEQCHPMVQVTVLGTTPKKCVNEKQVDLGEPYVIPSPLALHKRQTLVMFGTTPVKVP